MEYGLQPADPGVRKPATVPPSSPWFRPMPGTPEWPQLPPWAQPVYAPRYPDPLEVWC